MANAEPTKTHVGVRPSPDDQSTFAPDDGFSADLEQLNKQIVELSIVDRESLGRLNLKAGEGAAAEIAELERLGLLTPFQVERIRDQRIDELRIDEYLLLSKIGQGGMGEVFRAKNLSLDRIEAIKVIRHGEMSPTNARRFHQEAKALARLEHPGIVPVYRIGRHRDLDFIAMKFVEGETLKDKMIEAEQTGTEFSISQACRWMSEAAEALGHAHRHGIIHRDIKPGNLMIDSNGRVVVLDLGIAQLQDPTRGASAAGLTQQARSMGTPEFMPPEQWADARHVSPESDVYSLACTFYWVLTGRPAVFGNQLVDLMRAHSVDPIDPPSKWRPEINPELDAVFLRSMAKHPKDRYPSMTDLVEALAPFAYEKQIVRTGTGWSGKKLTDSLNSATEVLHDRDGNSAARRTAAESPPAPSRRSVSLGATSALIVGCGLALWAASLVFSPDDSTESRFHAAASPRAAGVVDDKLKQGAPLAQATDSSLKPVGDALKQDKPLAPDADASKAEPAKRQVDRDGASPPVVSKAAPAAQPHPAPIQPFALIRKDAVNDDWSRHALHSVRTIIGSHRLAGGRHDALQISFVDEEGRPASAAKVGDAVFARVEASVGGRLCFVQFDGKELFVLPIESPVVANEPHTIKTRFRFSQPGRKRFIVYLTDVPLVDEPVLPDNAPQPTFPKLFTDARAADAVRDAMETGGVLEFADPPADLRFCCRVIAELEVTP